MRLLDLIAPKSDPNRMSRGGQGGGDSPVDHVESLLDAYLDEWRSAGGRCWAIHPTDFASGRAILGLPGASLVAAVDVVLERLLEESSASAWTRGDVTTAYAVQALTNQLLRKNVPLHDDDVVRVLDLVSSHPSTWSGFVSLPLLVPCVERALGKSDRAPAVRAALERLRAVAARHASKSEARKAIGLIDSLLRADLPTEEMIGAADDWGIHAHEALAGMEGARRASWTEVVRFALTATQPTPSGKWLARARERIDALTEPAFRTTAIEWLDLLGRPGRNEHRETATGFATTSAVIVEPNATLLKGLAWCCALDDSPEMARALADAVEACFRKLPGVQCRSLKVGTACVWALGAMEGTGGIAQLQRLRGRVKLKAGLAAIDKALDEAARRAGMTRDDLDDLSVPTFGLTDGRIRAELGGYVAEVAVVGARGAELRWFGPDGKPRKSVPAAVKSEHAVELKALKLTAGDVEKALSAQVARIERLLLAERSWAYADWRERYLDHPLLAAIARRLIWQFDANGRSELGAWRDGAIVGPDERPLAGLDAGTRVCLWHPIGHDAGTVEAWRRWLERHEITQPFKQAHREVYVLTDAELRTRTYSNRFAGHVLRQHQFHALCQQRGWSFRLLGWWDGWNAPTLELPRWNLRAVFTGEGVMGDDDSRSDAHVCLHVATDQVRFDRPGGTNGVSLAEVPPLVFSEVMRDVDLFVGVCSVGNDPTWRDGGPERHRAYWESFGFGELSETARTRRVVLERLLPRLKIAPRCSLEDRFLVVRGDLRTYRIHLGSGNVLMEPNNQYLCIVPDRRGGPKDVFLPFDGDAQMAVILSKAFLLANDTGITDPTIRCQIR